MQWPALSDAARQRSEVEIPTLPGYYACRDGRILSARRGPKKPVAITRSPAGLRVTLWAESLSRMVTLNPARLLASVFLNPCGADVGFRNEDPTDLRAENLYWKDSEVHDAQPEGTVRIPGFSAYAVNRHGQIYSSLGRTRDGRWRKMTPSADGRGYMRVMARDDSNSERTLKVHTAVLLAFVGPPPTPRHECRHLDRDKSNNSLQNLCWGLPVRNADDRIRHGTQVRGSLSPMAKLTEADILAIRAMWETGRFSQQELADAYAVTKATVGRICRHESWVHVAALQRPGG